MALNTMTYAEAAVHVLHQPGSVAWEVFDEALLPLTRSFPDFIPAEAAGALRRADDVAQLAPLIGCDEITLRNTLDSVDPARPDPLGRRDPPDLRGAVGHRAVQPHRGQTGARPHEPAAAGLVARAAGL